MSAIFVPNSSGPNFLHKSMLKTGHYINGMSAIFVLKRHCKPVQDFQFLQNIVLKKNVCVLRKAFIFVILT